MRLVSTFPQTWSTYHTGMFLYIFLEVTSKNKVHTWLPVKYLERFQFIFEIILPGPITTGYSSTRSSFSDVT